MKIRAYRRWFRDSEVLCGRRLGALRGYGRTAWLVLAVATGGAAGALMGWLWH